MTPAQRRAVEADERRVLVNLIGMARDGASVDQIVAYLGYERDRLEDRLAQLEARALLSPSTVH